MNPVGELLVALAIIVGLFGIVVPVLPGLILILAAVLIWAFETGTTTGWVVAVVSVVLGVGGTVVKYLIPGRKLKESGLPTLTLVLAVAVGIAGLFVIPILGAPLGFVATIYVAERIRVGQHQAWPATKTALGAVAASVGIELATGLLITAIWFSVVIFG